MKYKRESYPDKIRRIAEDLSQIRNLYEADHSAEKLRIIADELEQNLKKQYRKADPPEPFELFAGIRK